MSGDRRILPQNAQDAQDAQMSSFSFAPQQYPQRETQKSASKFRLCHAPASMAC